MSEGLIDTPSEKQEAVDSKEALLSPTQDEATWYWDEGVPGTGERPEWLKENYSNVGEQAKAYTEASKRLREPSSAPENYDLSSYNEYFDINNENFSELKDKAKKHGLSQEAMNDVINPIYKYQESFMPNRAREIEKLGENGEERVKIVNRWASNILSNKSVETLGLMANRAEHIELFDEIRQKFGMSESQPPENIGTLSTAEIDTIEKIRMEVEGSPENTKRYLNDREYEAEIHRRYARVYGED